MESTRDKSVKAMPAVLVALTAVLVLVRFVDLAMAPSRLANSSKYFRALAWQDMPSLDRAKAEEKLSIAPPPEPAELSPDSQAQLDRLLTVSRLNHKFVLYQFYADWSDPCKKMERTSLSNPQVTGLIDHNFIPVRVTDRFKEKGKNPRLVSDLQKKFRVFAFPTLVIVGEDGQAAGTLIGNCSSLTTYRFLSRTLSSLHKGSRRSQLFVAESVEHHRTDNDDTGNDLLHPI